LSTVDDFVNETGDPYRIYPEGTIEQSNMSRSEGVQGIRDLFIKGGCKKIRGFYGKWAAFSETKGNIGSNPTQAQFGGYAYTVTLNSNGTASFTQINIPSAFYHGFLVITLPKKPRGGLFPWMGNVNQRVTWIENISCECD